MPPVRLRQTLLSIGGVRLCCGSKYEFKHKKPQILEEKSLSGQIENKLYA